MRYSPNNRLIATMGINVRATAFFFFVKLMIEAESSYMKLSNRDIVLNIGTPEEDQLGTLINKWIKQPEDQLA